MKLGGKNQGARGRIREEEKGVNLIQIDYRHVCIINTYFQVNKSQSRKKTGKYTHSQA